MSDLWEAGPGGGEVDLLCEAPAFLQRALYVASALRWICVERGSRVGANAAVLVLLSV